MSFSAAYTEAENRGYNPATLLPFNPADEARAASAITDTIFGILAAGKGFLERLAPVIRESGKAWDVCLDCTVAGTDDLSVLARIGQPGLKYPGLFSYTKAEQDVVLRQVARLSMFDIPRQLVADKLKLWVYHLFDNVYILSPKEHVDINWALQRHAVRVRWTGQFTPEPATLPVAESAAVVAENLQTVQAAGWQYLLNWHAANPGTERHAFDTADTESIAPALHNVIGSLTGRELLARHTGRRDWHYYNCHSPATGGDKPSYVLQLQNQHPTLENC